MIESLSVLGSVVAILAGLATVAAFLQRRERYVSLTKRLWAPGEATLEIAATNVGTHDDTLISRGFGVADPIAEPRAFV